MFRRKKWTAAGAPTTSGSGPAHRRARYVAGGVTTALILPRALRAAGVSWAVAEPVAPV